MKKSRPFPLIAMAALILIGSACSNANKDSSSGLPDMSKKGLPPAGAIEPTVARVAGTWKMDCQANGKVFETARVVIGPNQQNRFVGAWTFYDDAGCRNPIYRLGITFNVKDDGTATDSYCDLLPTMVAAELTFLSSNFVAGANARKFCSFDNWAMNKATSILGLTCGGIVYRSKAGDRITLAMNPNGTLSIKDPYDTSYHDFHR